MIKKNFTLLVTFNLISLIVCNQSTGAIHLSESASGQVGIVPFYSTANDLNTLLSVSNNTNRYKAIRVSVRESKNSVLTLNRHIYLSPNDTWTAGLTLLNGLPTLVTNDNSCMPFSATDNFPGIVPLSENAIEAEEGGDIPIEELIQRMKTGLIEIYDLGDLTEYQNYIDPQENTLDCDLIKLAWAEGGIWALDPSDGISQPSGGLSVSASLIHVENGFSVNVDTTLFEDFYPSNSSVHGTQEQDIPDLSSAQTSSMLIHQGQATLSEWTTGFEAVGALLNQFSVSSDFVVDPAIAGEMEWILSFPTKRYHVQSDTVIAPFSNIHSNGDDICAVEFNYAGRIFSNSALFGRDGLSINPPLVNEGSPPPPPLGLICEAINIVTVFPLDSPTVGIQPGPILSDGPISALLAGEKEGMAKVSFPEFTSVSNGTPSIQFTGLPILGFSVQKYQNANAQPGLLAAYATAIKHRSKRLIEFLNQ